jgi:N-carbamoylputrescine amidase
MGGEPLVKIATAAVQMQSSLGQVDDNLQRADALLREAHEAGVELAVLPEMFNTGYGLVPDYTPIAESADGPTLRHLAERSRRWGMTIAAGFVERSGNHLYDSLAMVEPNGDTHVYRKRNLVFWERFRFFPGREPVVVRTRFGRVGLAICADMIYKRVWADYRGRIDLAVVASAWPDFADRHSGRKHWLFGHVGPLSGAIPFSVAADLGIPVVFANQCGETQTVIPILRTRIKDRFAGLSSITDGRHGPPIVAGTDDQLLISEVTLHPAGGPIACRSTFASVPVASSSVSAHS